MMTVRGIHLKSLIFASLAASYLMFFVDKWFAGTLGLFGAFPGTSSTWWMIEHHLDGILIALLFAWPFLYTKLPGPGWGKGLVFGIFWNIALIITALIASALGANPFSQMPSSAGAVITGFLLHMIWGTLLGALYNPPNNVGGTGSAPQTA
jgi:hypothetical protein